MMGEIMPKMENEKFGKMHCHKAAHADVLLMLIFWRYTVFTGQGLYVSAYLNLLSIYS